MKILTPPHVDQRPKTRTLGITVETPYRGMLGVRDALLAELITWLDRTQLEPTGSFFLRFHTLDPDGPVQLEVGILDVDHPGDQRVRPGTLPAGRYLSMAYSNHATRAAQHLLRWATEQGLTLDVDERANGQRYGCRYEAYRNDLRYRHLTNRCEVELAIRLADADLLHAGAVGPPSPTLRG